MESIQTLAALLSGRRVVALTGAGISTESGIPDYRGEGTLQRAKSPLPFQVFAASEAQRRRYWARSMIGWPRLAAAAPNAGHHALAALEHHGLVSDVITQNVDRLHQRAGQRAVIELHGALADVRCLDCGAREPRDTLQRRLEAANPNFEGEGAILPDGDAALEGDPVAHFVALGCRRCGGTIKPDVVFFGEAVPRAVVDSAYARIDQAEALLVLGSSLAVFSGYRFVRRAKERGLPVAIVNLGPTRGDKDATVKLEARLGDALSELAETLIASVLAK